jgi:hypothetical protein
VSDGCDTTSLIDIDDRHVLARQGCDYNDLPQLREVFAGALGFTLFISVEITREA